VRIHGGEDFTKLARDLSEDTVTAGSGGELPVFSRGQMPKGFEEAAFALKPGAVSGVVRSPVGFHIIKLLERLPSVHLSYDDVKDSVKQSLVGIRKKETIDKLLATLRAKAKIEIYV